MSTPRFLADENIEPAIVSATRRIEPAIDFQTIDVANLLGASDVAVLEYAHGESRIVVSHDFNTLIAAAKARIIDGAGVAGLMMVPAWLPPRTIAESIALVWGASTAEEWRDRIVFLPF
jgi:hypothetical protein